MLIFLERQTVLQWPTRSSSSRHSHSYKRATMTGQTTLEQTKTTIEEADFIARKALIYM